VSGDGGGGVGGGVELEVGLRVVGLLRGRLGVVVGHGGRGREEVWQWRWIQGVLIDCGWGEMKWM